MDNQTQVTVNVAGPQPIVIRQQPGCLVQLLYFVVIGWWLGALAITLAYLLFVTVLLIPLGVSIINKLPYLMALRQTEPMVSYLGAQTAQHNILLRAVWFAVVGWWAMAIWLALGYIACLTIIGMPIGFFIFDRAPAVLTLHRA